MAGTLEGAIKAKQTLYKKYGGKEGYRKWLKEIGSIGGKNSSGYEFAHGLIDPAVAGAKGGAKSRRKPLTKKINGDK